MKLEWRKSKKVVHGASATEATLHRCTVKKLTTSDDGAVCREEELVLTNMEDFELENFNNEWESLNPSIRYDEPSLLIELTGLSFIFILGLGLKRFFQMINPF